MTHSTRINRFRYWGFDVNRLFIALVLSVLSLSANSALIDRGGGLVYDEGMNVTWLQDANYALTSGHSAASSTGTMWWSAAVEWADGLTYYDSIRDVTYDDWRLPTVLDIGAPGCELFTYMGGTECGYNVAPGSGEMAALFYSRLGNIARYDTEGNVEPLGWGLTNTGPFTNIQSLPYWYGTPDASDGQFAWIFNFETGPHTGRQTVNPKSFFLHAWALRDGDVTAVPIPAAVWLFGSALGLLGWTRRRIN